MKCLAHLRYLRAHIIRRRHHLQRLKNQLQAGLDPAYLQAYTIGKVSNQEKEPDMHQEQGIDTYAAMLAQKGGFARAERLTPERQRIIARNAAIAKHHPEEFQRQNREGQSSGKLDRASA